MNALVSIIVPIYNAEKYLCDCLDSLVLQSYKNIEIILVNDGSTDNSFKICTKFETQDLRVKIVNKENGGVASARNLGLTIAKGEYILFVDSDDFVDKNYVSKMCEEALKNSSDLVFCQYASYIDGKIVNVKESLPHILTVDIKNDEFKNFVCGFLPVKRSYSTIAFRVLYKKEVINRIYFDLNLRIGEDWVFLLKAIFNSKKITSIGYHLYYYRKNQQSVTHSYRKNYLENQLKLYNEIGGIFACFDSDEVQSALTVNNALLCYSAFLNEIRYRNVGWGKEINKIRKSELYPYFRLKNGLKIRGLKSKFKFIVIWVLVKFRLV